MLIEFCSHKISDCNIRNSRTLSHVCSLRYYTNHNKYAQATEKECERGRERERGGTAAGSGALVEQCNKSAALS